MQHVALKGLKECRSYEGKNNLLNFKARISAKYQNPTTFAGCKSAILKTRK